MMMTEMDIETSVYYVHLTWLIAREDFIKFTRRKSTKTYIDNLGTFILRKCGLRMFENKVQEIYLDLREREKQQEDE
jgi:hypothetical protein